MRAVLGICTKNNENTIRKQLEIIISQKRKPDEIVFVDSSQDETPEIIDTVLGETNIAYKIIRQKGRGLGDARQEIYMYAKKRKYDIIVFLDTEKYPVSKYWFENHLKFHITNRNFAILNGRFVKRDYEPKSPFKDGNYFIQCNCSIKIEYLNKVGGYDRRFERGEDWDLAIRLYKVGARSFVSSSVAERIHKADSLSTFIKKKLHRSSSIKFLSKYRLYYLKNYPQHLIADTLGVINLVSLAFAPTSFVFAYLYLLSLLTFSSGMYKSNKNIVLSFKWAILLLPLIYGLTALRDIAITVSKPYNRCKTNGCNNF